MLSITSLQSTVEQKQGKVTTGMHYIGKQKRLTVGGVPTALEKVFFHWISFYFVTLGKQKCGQKVQIRIL